MARPTKQGIDYFPLDVQFDEKVELFVAEQGASGLGILVTIWQLIYQNNGYFVHNDDDLRLLVRRRTMADLNTIDAVIKSGINRRIFDADMNNAHNILTSKAIQKRFFVAAKKKKEVSVIQNYLFRCIKPADNMVFDVGNATKEEEEEEEEKNTASGDADDENEVDSYRSKKGKTLKGKCLEDFKAFWIAFSLAKGKAEAADAWLSVYSPKIAGDIIAGAGREAAERKFLVEKGQTPKWAQGWLTGRRWEDQENQSARNGKPVCETCKYKVIEKLNCWQERTQCNSHQPM